MTEIYGSHEQQIVHKGAIKKKLTLYILELIRREKKKVIGISSGSFETYTRYSGGDEDEQ